MSGPPIVYRTSSVTASPYRRPATSVYQSTSIPIQGRVASSAGFKVTNEHALDSTLKDIKRRYEDEAKSVQQNYEVDYHNQVYVTRTIEELEVLLEEERRRSVEFENKFNMTAIELDKERRLRMDYEHECAVLRDDLRKAEMIISDSELRISRLKQDLSHVESENKSLRAEIYRLSDLYNSKVHDIEDKYISQLRDLTTENERLKIQLEQQRADYETRLRGLDQESRIRYASLEDGIREKDRLIVELEGELRKLADHISHVKIEFEEELRRQLMLVREEEQCKYHIALKNVEVKMQQILDERDLLVRKNQELVRDVHLRERQIQDIKMQYDAEVNRLKNEINDLRGHITVITAVNDKLKGELINKDTIISRLEAEISNFEREIQRLKDIHVQEVNRLINDQNNERKRWEETERILKERIAEIERIIRSLENENAKLRTDLERLKEQVTGNVHRTIFQTFVDYETTQPRVTKTLY